MSSEAVRLSAEIKISMSKKETGDISPVLYFLKTLSYQSAP